MQSLLLINPGHLAAPNWGWRSFPAHLHHLWSALVGSGQVDVVDYNLLLGAPRKEDREKFLEFIRSDISNRNFDLAGISCWSSLNVTASIAVAKIIRETHPQAKIFVGGYHPSARLMDFPDALFDRVVCGCGIGALRAAMKGEAGDGERIVNCVKPELAKPVWEGFPYGGPVGGAVGIYLSRGCPFHCSFCMESVMGRRWMALEPREASSAVVQAINFTKTPFLQLYDPLFGLSPRWRREFLDELIRLRKQFNPKTFIWAQVRGETISDADVKKLSKFRVQLAIGLESASHDILLLMNKTRRPDWYLKRFAEFSDYLDGKKVHHQAFLVFNHPGETPQSLDEARSWLIGLLRRKKKSYLTLMGQPYAYFPGSPLEEKWELLNKRHGTKVLHPKWWLEDEDHHDKATAVIPSAALEQAGQLGRWREVMREINTLNLEVASKENLPDVQSFAAQFEKMEPQMNTDKHG